MGANDKFEAAVNPMTPEKAQEQWGVANNCPSRYPEKNHPLEISDAFPKYGESPSESNNSKKRLGTIGSSSFRTLDKIVRDTGVGNVIDKLTAPPETLLEHLDRLKVSYLIEWPKDYQGDDPYEGTLVLDMSSVRKAENPKE